MDKVAEAESESDNGRKEEHVLSTSNWIIENGVEIMAKTNVFYNPVQEFNRDLSSAVLNTFSELLQKERANANNKSNIKVKKNNINKPEDIDKKTNSSIPECKEYDGLRILEALSATGLRSIRYAKEVNGIKEIIANDLSRVAVDTIRANVAHNKIEHIVKPNYGDAMTLMYLSTSPEKRFDCIDLDPYGSPILYLDAALQAIKDGGLLLVTATDMAVLSGNAADSCYVKYGSIPLKIKSCHEMALRILLYSIDKKANCYGKYIVPLLSVSVDFYIRVFVRVYFGQAKCKLSITKQSLIYQCTGCETFTLQPLSTFRAKPNDDKTNNMKLVLPTGPSVDSKCIHCHHKHHTGGPIWSAPIHDKTFVNALLESLTNYQPNLIGLGTCNRLIGILTMIEEELDDVPLYYSLQKLCGTLKLPTMPILQFRSVLLYAGYNVSFSHANRNSIKTDAPASVIFDILRKWNKMHPVKESRLVEGTVLHSILTAPCQNDFDLEYKPYHPNSNPKSRFLALNRFQINPTPHWGPGSKASIMVSQNKGHLHKSQSNQNKKKKRQETRLIHMNESDSINGGTLCKQTKLE